MSTPSAHRHDRPADSRSGWPQGTLSAANQCESDWIGGCVCFHVRMSQALAEHEVFDAGSRKGARRGVVVGVVATLVLAVAAWGADQVLSSGPRTFTTTCSGANVTGMIWVDASGVFTSASVVDPEGRRWDVRWGGYAEEIAGSAMVSPTSQPDYSGTLVSATQTLGDTDDGTHRIVQVRPRGQRTWCALNMHVSLLW